MKPDNSLEKAARTFAKKQGWCNIDDYPEGIVHDLALFAQRHGAKVRRETLKEAAAICDGTDAFYSGCGTPDYGEGGPIYCSELIKKRILSLTSRGPEKGRRHGLG